MRQITIDFDKMLVSGLVDNKYAGYLGEHNATEITVIKPVGLDGEAFAIAFMTNGEVVHSKFFNGDETISVALWQQLTQDNTLYVQLEAYDRVGNYLGKSNVAKLNLGCSVHGIDVIADADNPDVYSEIALNTWFRETLEDNVDTLNELTTREDGKLLFKGKLIEGTGGASDQLDIQVETDTEDEYVLSLSTPDETITTPNLKGKEGKQGVSGVYVGTGEMPDGYNVQIDPTGEAVVIPTKTSELINDSGFITAEQLPENGGGGVVVETDPTVPDWAKEPEPPKYNASEIAYTNAIFDGEVDNVKSGLDQAISYVTTELPRIEKKIDDKTVPTKEEIVADVLEALPTWNGGAY